MKLKKEEFIIDSANPFKNDVLERKDSAEILTDLLLAIRDPFVISIDSPWGTGKTTFVRMWQQHLKNAGYNCLYFNAWETDFHIDPLVPLIGEIQMQVLNQLGESGAKAKEYFEIAKKIGGGLIRRTVPAVAKIATVGILDLNEITETIASEWIAEIAQERIDKYENDRNTINEFRKYLTHFASEMYGKGNKPIVFFIDELDRCRPSYAIELLERIKHIFNVPGIVFVLVLDLAQLESATKTIYGINMKVDGYLGRFIDLHYRLPEAAIKQFCEILYNQLGFREYFRGRQNGFDESQQLLESFVEISTIFGLSLRTLEQCFTRLSIALSTY